MNRLNNLYHIIYLLSLPLFSQELGEVTVYNTTNSSLCYDQINDIEFGPNNQLWIGTQNGLNTFSEDGSWMLFDASTPSNQLASNVIRSLEWAANESLSTMFIGTNYGITAVTDNNWNGDYGDTCNPNNGIINTIFYDTELWAGSTEGLCVEGFGGEGTWLLQNTSTGWYSNNITSIKQNSNNGVIGIGTMNGGLITYNGDFNIYYSSNSGILDNTVLDLAFDQNNNIIICTPQAGLGVLTSTGSWVWLNTLNSNLPTNSLTNVVVDNNNNLWITTLEDGLVHYINNTFYHYTAENSNLPDNNINCLEFDSNNNLWLGTETSGIVKITNPLLYNNSNLKNTIKVHPTIFNDYFYVETNQKSIAKIYNQKGQIIDSYVISKGKEKINTVEYKPGLYFITMNYAENRKTYKLIKY